MWSTEKNNVLKKYMANLIIPQKLGPIMAATSNQRWSWCFVALAVVCVCAEAGDETTEVNIEPVTSAAHGGWGKSTIPSVYLTQLLSIT